MVHAQLFVAQYASMIGSGHWAFHFDIRDGNTSSHLIYETVLEPKSGRLVFRERTDVLPHNSPRYVASVFVDDLADEKAIGTAKTLIKNQEIHNERPEWNCRNWVVEALEALICAHAVGPHNGSKARDRLLNSS